MEITRPPELRIGRKCLQLPVYFPSVSSVKTGLRPLDYLQILSSLQALNGQYLVSAFDLATIEAPKQAASMIATSRAAGAVLLMDSGNYECFWKDAQASWGQADFHRILKAYTCDLAFGFDEQQPPADTTEHVALVVSSWQADQEAAGACQIIPIIHATVNQLPALCATVGFETGVSMLAVPERKLGDGIIERARAVKTIRTELDKLGRYIALHLLGTGNPISIALYSAMGADSFDGLEWCQTVVDHDTAQLHHLSQADFFAGQTNWCDVGLSFQARTLAHNLEFFSGWIQRLRNAMNEGRVVDFCRHNFSARVFQQCAQACGWGS
jgi:hypothetical protein